MPKKRKATAAWATNLQAARESLSTKRQKSTPTKSDSDQDLEAVGQNDMVGPQF